MCDPQEYRKQHYISQFWQKRFADSSGTVYGLSNGVVSPVAVKNSMAEDWLYTTYDDLWRPSNILEQQASRMEALAAPAFRSLDMPNSVGSIGDQIQLRHFVAFSACRHPDTMSAGHRKAKDFARQLASAPSLDMPEFCAAMQEFGIALENAAEIFAYLRDCPPDKLQTEVREIEAMSPNDPRLPKQLAISQEAIERVFFQLGRYSIAVLESPLDAIFVLGDTPFPINLAQGFTVPVSSELALHWEFSDGAYFPEWTRRVASRDEVDACNQRQVDNSLKLVIGSSRDVLRAYIDP